MKEGPVAFSLTDEIRQKIEEGVRGFLCENASADILVNKTEAAKVALALFPSDWPPLILRNVQEEAKNVVESWHYNSPSDEEDEAVDVGSTTTTEADEKNRVKQKLILALRQKLKKKSAGVKA